MALTKLDGPAPSVANAALKPPESAPKPRPVSRAAASISGQLGAATSPAPSRPSMPSAKVALPIITEVRRGKRVRSAPSSSGPSELPRKWALLMPATVAVPTPKRASKLGKAGP